MFASIIAAILAIFKAIPVLQAWWTQLNTAILDADIANHNTDMANAYLDILNKHDQTSLEKAIGSPNAGKSGTDQSDIVDRPIGGGLS